MSDPSTTFTTTTKGNTMNEMTNEQAQQLRAPFPAERIQKLPTGGMQLDYVSHAWVTDRLLAVDPHWTWQPVAFDADGLPKFDANGGLWIELTVCGVTRLGYGEPQGRDKFDQTKGAIGNALRNAAMRFGVALDLWAREVSGASQSAKPAPKTAPKAKPKPESDQSSDQNETALANNERLALLYFAVAQANTKDELREIWAENADIIDIAYNGATLREAIMERQNEVAE